MIDKIIALAMFPIVLPCRLIGVVVHDTLELIEELRA